MVPVELTGRKITKAIQENVYGRGGSVYCDLSDGSRWRIIRVSMRHGQLYVLRMAGGWVAPIAVYKEW